MKALYDSIFTDSPTLYPMVHYDFAYPWWGNQHTQQWFQYEMNETLCDSFLCDCIRKRGHINGAQLLMQDRMDDGAILLDVGSHMAEYMPMTVLQGAQYVSIEASPVLHAFQQSVLDRNPTRQSQVELLNGYFSARDQTTCISTDANFFQFISLGCPQSTIHIPRYDMSLVSNLKRDFSDKILFVKYDAMINLCEFKDTVDLGDYVDYEYVNWRYGTVFRYGFPHCFNGTLERHYHAFVPDPLWGFGPKLKPVEKIPEGPTTGSFTHVVLVKRLLI